MSFEVETPIINSPFREPEQHWRIRQGETPVLSPGRRRSVVFQPPEQTAEWDLSDGTLAKAASEHEGAYAGRTYEMVIVNRIRERVRSWREAGYPGATRTSRELIEWWRRDGQEYPLFFAQVEAATTVIFLKEARQDLLQGITIPLDDAPDAEAAGFQRLACKMATGSGKTTVMGMLAAWSILNKVANRTSRTHSDAIVVICPNVTIRDRLRELDPTEGQASVYHTRRLIPAELMPQLARGRVLVTNWHVLEPQSTQQGTSARVIRAGVPVETTETVIIGDKNTTARGSRYMTRASYEALVAGGEVFVKSEELDGSGLVKKATLWSRRYVESDSALLERVLGREIGRKENLLIFNDEAHHAYRISQGLEEETDAESLGGTPEDDEEIAREATVWVEGLDKVHAQRGINFCVDLSATPYFLARAGKHRNARPFPWTVSDFGLIDAIESGLVKIPQLPTQDTTGAERPAYFNIWEWVKTKLTPAERGGPRGNFRPEAVLKYAYQPIAMLAGDWRTEFQRWTREHEDARPPVFIIVCRDVKLAKTIFEWMAEDRRPEGIPPLGIAELRNVDGEDNTIRVDWKVVADTDAGVGAGGDAKADRARWMRFTLDTVGKRAWPADAQGRPIYPAGFEELAKKMERSLDPPGRRVRCIVSVGMLTEGWDANTVTHIIGLRPFMSQLLCEQVVGRGLRRASYDVSENGLFTEEVAQVFGVPFEVIPFKGTGAVTAPKPKRYHVHALPQRKHLEIRFPRVVGYTQAVRNRVTVDWKRMPTMVLQPGQMPTLVDVGALAQREDGKITVTRLGVVREVTMKGFYSGMRHQEGVFRMAGDLTRQYRAVAETQLPAHVLFPQFLAIVYRFVRAHVQVPSGSDKLDLFTAPYYGWAIEILHQQIRPDEEAGETPELPRFASPPAGTTSAVDFWTSRPTGNVTKSHVNYVVADTAKWEQQAAYYIDKHDAVEAFVKNSGLGLTIPYLYNGQPHDFTPDFVIRLAGADERYLVLETKGFDPLGEIKASAAHRWSAAVNADGRHGKWSFAMARSVSDVSYLITEAARSNDAIAHARAFGIDMDQRRESLRRMPDERLSELDAGMELLRELRTTGKTHAREEPT